MKEYTIIYEWAGSNYSAYVPDLPGCITTGRTLEDTERSMHQAIQLYLEQLVADGEPVPELTTRAGSISVAA